jgi:1-deoxy-D-xylulose-5-phosphate synthase
MAQDERIVVITPAMLEGSGITALQQKYPDRVIDVGIAEQHSVTLAAGMAAGGMRPIVAIYSTFLQRAYDSVIHDVAVQGLPVIFAIDRAGLVGEDGRTHQGFADLSFLRLVPGMAVAAASDDVEVNELLRTALTYESPFAIRYPRGNAPVRASGDTGITPAVGTGVVVRDGDDVTLLGIGTPVQDCLRASDRLQLEGISAGVVNARFAKPLDDELILQVASRGRGIITVEENVQAGGFGEGVLALLSEHGMADRYLGAVTLPDAIVEHATQSEQRASAGIDSSGIARRVIELLRDRNPTLDVIDGALPAGIYPIATTRAG